MFREMRRSKQVLPENETYEIIDNATSGVLCLLGDDDYPYGVPLSHVRQGNIIYFHSALTGHKVDAVRNHDKACFTVVAQDDVMPDEYATNYKSAIVFGHIHIVEDEAEKDEAAHALGERFNPGHPKATDDEVASGIARMHMFALEIEHVTGKESLKLSKARRKAAQANG